jgi:glucokinase
MNTADVFSDDRVVMTLDAGGTNFRFSAMRAGKLVVETLVMPASTTDLSDCLLRVVEGFRRVSGVCPARPAAISFGFPGPADYPRGIIGDLGNLPCFRGGVALGPLLRDTFQIPVFVNNDGDLFAYGEAAGGFLPYINGLLEKAESPKRFENLLGVTLGTGLGGGIVRRGELFVGDNSVAGELWLVRNKRDSRMNAEEGASARAVKAVYAECSRVPLEEAPEPHEIHEIALGKGMGDTSAAIEAFRRLGEITGDAIANALTLVDGLVVIGGGLSGAAPLFLPALVSELNGEFELRDGRRIRRLATRAFNAEEADQLSAFLKGSVREIQTPPLGTVSERIRKFKYDALPRVAVGLSRLGTSMAIALGAYAFALKSLEAKPA